MVRLRQEFQDFEARYYKECSAARSMFVDGIISFLDYMTHCAGLLNDFKYSISEENPLTESENKELDALVCEMTYPFRPNKERQLWTN